MFHHWTPEAATAVDEWLAKYGKSESMADWPDPFDDPRIPRNEDDVNVRAMAAKGLGKLGYSSSISTLLVVLREDQSFTVSVKQPWRSGLYGHVRRLSLLPPSCIPIFFTNISEHLRPGHWAKSGTLGRF